MATAASPFSVTWSRLRPVKIATRATRRRCARRADRGSRIVRRDLHTAAAAEAAAAELLTGPEPPSALFSAQNLITLGTVRALRAIGVQHRTALVGFDDVPLADMLDPPVTVVAQDVAAIGTLAAQILFRRIDGDVSEPRRTSSRPAWWPGARRDHPTVGPQDSERIELRAAFPGHDDPQRLINNSS